MTIQISKFLNTATHFSIDSWQNLMVVSHLSGVDTFCGLSGEVSRWTTESETRQPLNGDIRITRMRAIAGINTADAPLVITFRNNSADTPATVTIPAGSTAMQDSGALSVTVSGGSLVNLKTRTDFSAGGIDQVSVEVQYERVLN